MWLLTEIQGSPLVVLDNVKVGEHRKASTRQSTDGLQTTVPII